MAVFIRTRLETGFGPNMKPYKKAFWERILFFIPEANPNYRSVMHLVDSWLIEFPDEDGLNSQPWREIGLNAEGVPVLAGPTDRDYGFWLDMIWEPTLGDFTDAEEVTEQTFEELWAQFFIEYSDRSPR
jgi:hypothetical protein